MKEEEPPKTVSERLVEAAEELEWCGCNDSYVRDTYRQAIEEIKKIAEELS